LKFEYNHARVWGSPAYKVLETKSGLTRVKAGTFRFIGYTLNGAYILWNPIKNCIVTGSRQKIHFDEAFALRKEIESNREGEDKREIFLYTPNYEDLRGPPHNGEPDEGLLKLRSRHTPSLELAQKEPKRKTPHTADHVPPREKETELAKRRRLMGEERARIQADKGQYGEYMKKNPSKNRNLDSHESDTTNSEDIDSDDSDWKHVRVHTMSKLILKAPIVAPRHERPHRLWMHAIDAQTEIEASMPGTMIPGTSWRHIELRAAMASFEK